MVQLQSAALLPNGFIIVLRSKALYFLEADLQSKTEVTLK